MKVKKLMSLDEKIVKNLPISENEKKIYLRRINKLKRDPKGFLKSSYDKRSKLVRAKLPIKYNGENEFTVISAVYNVEKYIEDYFESLVNQSLNFKKHIKLILVDDGSTDSSAKIIKKWQEKYPLNITYLYKENGGQASARNLGIEFVNTEWVTFIDPDDFISNNYFLELNNFIENSIDMAIIACPLGFYVEDEKIYKNNHPLNYRFKNGNQILSIANMDKNIQLSASTAIFKYNLIRSIKFNESIRPSFEDAKFVLDFMLANIENNIGFISNISYHYRKRAAGNSTLDTAWLNPLLFSTVLREGVLASLSNAEVSLGYIPRHIQTSALYHVYWYFGRIINKKNGISHLSNEEKEEFIILLRLIFDKIDQDTIEKFNLAGAWFFHKVGFLGLFKNTVPKQQILYIENYDVKKNQILIRYFSNVELLENFSINGKDIIPIYRKKVVYNFENEVFTNEYRLWLPCNDLGILRIQLDKKDVKITFKSTQYNSIQLSEVKNYFTDSLNYGSNSWLFIDSSHKADDNAEHLYRYISNNYPQSIFFALNKDSKDWNRLNEEGFNLLEFGSEEFENLLRSCEKIISSNIDGYITNYFKDNSLNNKDFIFLQHGIILHDLSTWLNTKKYLNLFVTTTEAEFQSICNDGPYIFTNKETKLTGLPRHDSLIKYNNREAKNILIMPTWRNNIVGKSINATKRLYNSGFINTQYFKFWKSFLDSEILEQLAIKYNCNITFAPHSNIEEYLSDFEVPEYIKVWHYSDGNIQELFQNSLMLITDYSSVAFEVAYLEKPILYYQFDNEEVFSGSHTFEDGYFSYRDNGFGPIVTTEKELLWQLEVILKNGGKTLEPYKTRMIETFPFRDGKNCERVYQAIVALDRPHDSEVSIDIIMEYVQQAITHEAWDLALERINNVLQLSDITQDQVKEIARLKEAVLQTGYQDQPVKLATILWHEKRLGEGLEKLKQVDSAELTDELLRLRVKLAILNNDFILARDSQKILLEQYSDNCTIEDWQFYMQLANV